MSKSQNGINLKKITLITSSILLAIIYLTSIPATAYVVGQANPNNIERLLGPVDLEKQVIVLSDPDSKLFRSASQSIVDSTHAVYINTKIHDVKNLRDLNDVFLENDIFILVWSFNTTLKGIALSSGEIIPWIGVAKLLKTTPTINHVFNAGNSEALQAAIASISKDALPNVFIQPAYAGIVDLQVSFLFTMWTISDLFINMPGPLAETKTYHMAGDVIKELALKFFEKNANPLLESNLDPKIPIGEENATIKKQVIEEWKKKHPDQVLNSAKFDPNEKNVPVYFKNNAVDGIASDILLAVLPDQSGLTGPIGFVLDFLFSVMIGDGYDDIQISNETIQLIVDLFHIITDLVGGKGIDESAGTALKSLVKLLLKEFPFGEQLLPYIELTIDGLFALKGGFPTIIEFIGKIIDTLLPDLPQLVKDGIKTLLGITSSLVDSLSSGEEFLPALGRALSGNLMGMFIDKLLNETLGIPLNTATSYREKVMAVGNAIVGILSGDLDIVDVLRDNFDTILVDVMNFIPNNHRDLAQKLGNVIGFGLSLLKMDKSKLLERAKQLLTSLLPDGINLPTTTMVNEKISSITLNKAQIIEKIATDMVTQIGIIKEAGTVNPTQIKSAVAVIWADVKPLLDPKLGNLLENATLWAFAFLQDKLSNTDRISFPDALDMVNGFLDYISSAPVNAIDTPTANKIKTIGRSILGVIGFVKDAPKQMRQLIAKTENLFDQFVNDPIGTIEPVLVLIFGDNSTIVTTYLPQLKSFAELALGIYKIIAGAEKNTFQGIMQMIFAITGTGIFEKFGVDIEPIVEVMRSLLPDVLGVANAPTAFEATQNIINLLASTVGGESWWPELQGYLDVGLNLILSAREIFENGIQWLFGQIVEWLGRQVEELVNQLLDSLVGLIPGSAAVENNLAHDFATKTEIVNVAGKPMEKAVDINGTVMDSGILSGKGDVSKVTSGDLGITLVDTTISPEFGGFSAFTLYIGVGLKLNFGFDTAGFKQLLIDVIFKGKDIFQGGIGDFFARLFSFFSISPILTAKLELGSFGSGKQSFMNFLLESLGLKLDFSGGGYFAMNLLTFSGGQFQFENFLKIIEWSFYFTITLSKELTLLDFLTAGIGGGVLNAVAEFLGLGGIKVIISFSLGLEVVKRAAQAGKPEESTFTLKITIGLLVTIELSLFIVGIKLWGGMDIILTFFMDLAAGTGLQIFLDVIFKFGVALTFLFTDWGDEFVWHAVHEELTSHDRAEQEANGAKGFDKDNDGLGDEYEATVPGLRDDLEDTDGDGLSDKYETQTSKSNPTKADSDNDGLDDGFEWNTAGTNVLLPDSDWDKLSDFDEVMVYKTDPNNRDSDADGLPDNFEVNHAWNISTIVPSVLDVKIGEKHYNDHTDPLVADTDGDGIKDGQEGERGAWYGNPILKPGLDPESQVDSGIPSLANWNLLIKGGGFTHPLDNDTDDDSMAVLQNGTISPMNYYLRDMSDSIEIDGQAVVFWVDGEPELRIIRTNPVTPDTDFDTGYFESGGSFENAPINIVMKSDGYELSLNPPTDPTDSDTDDDGLIDGIEGVRTPAGNRTDPNLPDTDGDGLGDMQELLLGANPLVADSDNDMVPDGQEWKFGTSLFLDDTDFDGLTDGQELYWFHTSPLIADSDGDGLSDGKEIFDIFTNPMDDDSDRDGLSDFEEVYVTFTLPNDDDTDDDGLLDGFEINTLNTSPFLWDTDGDSITYTDPTSASGISQKWGDFEEFTANITNPTLPDSDLDGIGDGWEVYLASGHIPTSVLPNPIPLNPASNDTDGDGLFDGQEMYIGNSTNLIYPFISFYVLYPYRTSPTNPDTDGDGLSDLTEVNVTLTAPDRIDTDNDTLTDFEEVNNHGTNPNNNDTDGDGLADNYELTQATLLGAPLLPSSSVYNSTWIAFINATYGTNATNEDSDGDLLPDGAEMFFYFNKTQYGINATFNPLVSDQLDSNGQFGTPNGVPDGLDLDSDYDGLPDGYEFMGMNTSQYNFTPTFQTGSGRGGGIFNPDSDYDSLPDGLEVWVIGTSPAKNDTDKDSFSDGIEERIGTDPLTPTTWNQFVSAMSSFSYLHVASPMVLSYNGKVIPIKVNAPSDTARTSFKLYQEQTNSWTGEINLVYDPSQDSWILPQEYLLLEKGNYFFKAFMYLDNGQIISDSVSFAILMPLKLFDFSNISPDDNVMVEIFVFGSLFGIGLLGTVGMMNAGQISNRFKKLLKKKDQEINE
jgi:hypothetical protein